MDEFELIARYFAPLAAAEAGALGLRDDAAVLSLPARRELVVTADMLVEGVHFRDEDPPESLGVKALAVNLSDLASMGAEPRAYLLTLALPNAWPAERRQRWLAGFTTGLAGMQREFGIVLVGGDTVSTPGPLALSITAFGTTTPAGAMRRAGARPGDILWVSGTIGDGALGLRVLQERLRVADPAARAALIGRYRQPQPRVALGRALAGLAHACTDISDGLVADVGHICRASGVTATLQSAAVPLSPVTAAAVAGAPALMIAVLTGGDDYELAFTAAAADSQEVANRAAQADIAVTAIGQIAEMPQSGVSSVVVLSESGHPIDYNAAGWRHF